MDYQRDLSPRGAGLFFVVTLTGMDKVRGFSSPGIWRRWSPAGLAPGLLPVCRRWVRFGGSVEDVFFGHSWGGGPGRAWGLATLPQVPWGPKSPQRETACPRGRGKGGTIAFQRCAILLKKSKNRQKISGNTNTNSLFKWGETRYNEISIPGGSRAKKGGTIHERADPKIPPHASRGRL
jgi:hypothetical protein